MKHVKVDSMKELHRQLDAGRHIFWKNSLYYLTKNGNNVVVVCTENGYTSGFDESELSEVYYNNSRIFKNGKEII